MKRDRRVPMGSRAPQ